MKKFIFIFIMISTIMLTANEINDLKFAIGLYKDKNYQFSKTQFELFITSYPESNYIVKAKYIYSEVLIILKEYKNAQKILNELLKISKTESFYSDVILNLGIVNYHLNDIKEAQQQLLYFL